MKTLFTFFISILFFAAGAQVPETSVLWLKGYGGHGFNGVVSNVTTTNDNGFIVCISTNSAPGTGNIDSLCTGLSGDRAVFLKYNSDASILEWTKCSADGGYLYAKSDGSFIFGGVTNAVPSGWAFKIQHEDALGTTLWIKTFGGDSASARLKGMITTGDGGFIMAGTTSYTDTDFTIHYGSFMDDDIAVIKVDSNGGKVWTRVIGGSSNDAIVAVVPAPGDGCYLVGTTISSDHDFASIHGGDDAYVVRLGKNGNIVWIDLIGGTGGDEADCAASDGKGGVLIGGASNSLDGDRTHFPSFGCPIWAMDVDSSKHILWNNCYGGGGLNCYANAISKAADGSIWIAGVSTLTGGDVDTQYGRDDAWFIHTDDTGKVINAKVLGSSLDDRGMMVYPLSNNNVIAGGFYDTSGGAFSGVPWYGGSNAFLAIFAPTSDGIMETGKAAGGFELYPNPACGSVSIVTKDNDKYNCTISDLFGNVVYRLTFRKRIGVVTQYWKPGLYFVQMTGENGYREVRKLIVRP